MERPWKTLLSTTLALGSAITPALAQDCRVHADHVAVEPFTLEQPHYETKHRDERYLVDQIRSHDALVVAEPYHSDPNDRAYLGSPYFAGVMHKGGARYLAVEWDERFQPIADRLHDGKIDKAGFVAEFRDKMHQESYTLTSGIDERQFASSMAQAAEMAKGNGGRLIFYDQPTYNSDPVAHGYMRDLASAFDKAHPGDCSTDDRTRFNDEYEKAHPAQAEAFDTALTNNRTSAAVNGAAIDRIDKAIARYEAQDHPHDPNPKVVIEAGGLHRQALATALGERGRTAAVVTLMPNAYYMMPGLVQDFDDWHKQNANIPALAGEVGYTVDTGHAFHLEDDKQTPLTRRDMPAKPGWVHRVFK